ncbi:hypothetical protein HYU21_01835 [Candidatus Woesearchaeota archaeon]|nr:hypothetical protein [Candidatus Woesearchaeota archaeon]
MSKTILHPQEVETFYVLPSLRKHLAHTLKGLGLKQKEIAHIMGINSATISQYRSSKRGHFVNFNVDIKKEIKKSALLIKDRSTYLKETQRLLRFIRETNALCKIHKLFSEVPKECDPLFMGCHNLVNAGAHHV